MLKIWFKSVTWCKSYFIFPVFTNFCRTLYIAYRVGIRGKKWWLSIFTWEADVSIQNSWILFRNVNIDIFLSDFRRSFAQYYFKKYINHSGHPYTRLFTK